MNVANVVEYVATDDKRQVIPWVKITDRQGNSREYAAEGVTPEENRQRRAPHDGLHRLPQPPGP
jgi:hypothetical protein